MERDGMPGGEMVAVVTGGSLGLGAALAEGLARDGWTLVIDGRDGAVLDAAVARLGAVAGDSSAVVGIAGDVTDAAHREAVAEEIARRGHLDLLVNNASTLGPSPLPALVDYPLEEFRRVLEVNVVAPLALRQVLAGLLRAAPAPAVLDITSDAAVEAYEGWGGYGASKAALERLSAVWAAENPWCRTWALDPGDLRTRMHQEAFPGEDISDRPAPATVVPAIVALLQSAPPSGRLRAATLLASAGPTPAPAGIEARR
ncbi:SDR family oxidoreductase [Acidiferrimicrobium sp. IK]|uniref:SDR family NAD(P)-dependent oxidoreductase n=1 Tax=Acidiferrimicrobium sp. IK TaxID=2871700 RepID=UPI0021CB6ABE|nr:SDR family oxidoreductase [Acidiferrimicrobium sp. IK]MCU4183264.1 SDR family oxidoreductase [Acidiferrimicrobium sp. IK]